MQPFLAQLGCGVQPRRHEVCRGHQEGQDVQRAVTDGQQAIGQGQVVNPKKASAAMGGVVAQEVVGSNEKRNLDEETEARAQALPRVVAGLAV
jgi:hypothetical protein